MASSPARRRGATRVRTRSLGSGRRRGWPTCRRLPQRGRRLAVCRGALTPPPPRTSPPTPTPPTPPTPPPPPRACGSRGECRRWASQAAGSASVAGLPQWAFSQYVVQPHVRGRATGRSRPRPCSSATRWARAPSTCAARARLVGVRRELSAAPAAVLELPRLRAQPAGGGEWWARSLSRVRARRRSRGGRGGAQGAEGSGDGGSGCGGGVRATAAAGGADGWQGRVAEGAWRRRGRRRRAGGGGGVEWGGPGAGQVFGSDRRPTPWRARVLVLRRHGLAWRPMQQGRAVADRDGVPLAMARYVLLALALGRRAVLPFVPCEVPRRVPALPPQLWETVIPFSNVSWCDAAAREPRAALPRRRARLVSARADAAASAARHMQDAHERGERSALPVGAARRVRRPRRPPRGGLRGELLLTEPDYGAPSLHTQTRRPTLCTQPAALCHHRLPPCAPSLQRHASQASCSARRRASPASTGRRTWRTSASSPPISTRACSCSTRRRRRPTCATSARSRSWRRRRRGGGRRALTSAQPAARARRMTSRAQRGGDLAV